MDRNPKRLCLCGTHLSLFFRNWVKSCPYPLRKDLPGKFCFPSSHVLPHSSSRPPGHLFSPQTARLLGAHQSVKCRATAFANNFRSTPAFKDGKNWTSASTSLCTAAGRPPNSSSCMPKYRSHARNSANRTVSNSNTRRTWRRAEVIHSTWTSSLSRYFNAVTRKLRHVHGNICTAYRSQCPPNSLSNSARSCRHTVTVVLWTRSVPGAWHSKPQCKANGLGPKKIYRHLRNQMARHRIQVHSDAGRRLCSPHKNAAIKQ